LGYSYFRNKTKFVVAGPRLTVGRAIVHSGLSALVATTSAPDDTVVSARRFGSKGWCYHAEHGH